MLYEQTGSDKFKMTASKLQNFKNTYLKFKTILQHTLMFSEFISYPMKVAKLLHDQIGTGNFKMAATKP